MTPNPPSIDSLCTFVDAVELSARHVIERAELDSFQTGLLTARFRPWSAGLETPLLHQMSPFYFLVRAKGHLPGPAAVKLGAGFLLIQRFASAIDQVEDDDLAGEWAEIGHVASINAGLTMFVLGLEQLWACDHEQFDGKSELRASLSRNLVRMSRGQSRELRSRGVLLSVADRVQIAIDKSAEFSLLTEFAAICGRNEDIDMFRERRIGDALALMVQVMNDLADLLGDGESDDIRTGTWNIPLTILLHRLEPESQAYWLGRLRSGDAAKGPELAAELFDSGTMAELANLVETHRICVHDAVASAAASGPYSAMFLAWVDDLAATFYHPPVLANSANIETVDTSTLALPDTAIFERLRLARRHIKPLERLPSANKGTSP